MRVNSQRVTWSGMSAYDAQAPQCEGGLLAQMQARIDDAPGFASVPPRPLVSDREARNIAYALGLVAVRTEADNERQDAAWERDLND